MVLEMSGRSKIHNPRPKLRLHQSEDCPKSRDLFHPTYAIEN